MTDECECSEGPLSDWWLLAFTDLLASTDTVFLGACIVPGPSLQNAIDASWAVGCNPGGNVFGIPYGEPGWRPRPEFIYKIYDLEECRRMSERPFEEIFYEVAAWDNQGTEGE